MQTRSLNDIRNNSQNLIYCNHKNVMDIGKSSDISHEKIRQAVRAWTADWRSKEAVAAEIIKAWRNQGGEDFGFHGDHSRNAQKLFRWIDGDSSRYRRYITLMTPTIIDVLPLQFRSNLFESGERLARIAYADKEYGDAKNRCATRRAGPRA